MFVDNTHVLQVITNVSGQTLGGNFYQADFGAAGSRTSWQAATDGNGLIRYAALGAVSASRYGTPREIPLRHFSSGMIWRQIAPIPVT